MTVAVADDTGPHGTGDLAEMIDDRFPPFALEGFRLVEDLAVEDVEGNDLDCLDAIVQRYPGDDAPVGRRAQAAEGEIPQTVEDDPLLIPLYPLENVGVVSEDDIRTIMRQPVRSAGRGSRPRRPYTSTIDALRQP